MEEKVINVLTPKLQQIISFKMLHFGKKKKKLSFSLIISQIGHFLSIAY